jgi:uncharacterized repeat protein (TIGR02543 family)
MKNKQKNLVLILTFTLLLVAWPGISAFAADNSFVPPHTPNSTFSDADAFVPGEVLAPAKSMQHAQEIAEFYGLGLKSYAYGIAVLLAPDAEEAVEQSLSMDTSMNKHINTSMDKHMGSSMDKHMDSNADMRMERSAEIPNLSLNMLYQAYGISYEYGHEAANKYSYEVDGNYGSSTHKFSSSALPYEHNKYGVARAAEFMPELNNAPHSFNQWHHYYIDSERAWGISTGKKVVVAVIDTGIDTAHPDFKGRISGLSYNSHTNQIGIEYVQDDHFVSHGTHVSGIIAAALNNTEGICGVAPDAQILMIKANNPSDPNSFDTASLIRGINYAVLNGADVINMSLGRHYYWGPLELMQDAIADAVDKGVTVVCAAGNDSYNHASYPAAYPEAIAVSSIMWGYQFDNLYSSSNYGPEIDVAAPGASIYSTVVGGYMYLSGTSMASPNVAGVAALIKAQNPGYTPQQVRDVLCQTARDTGELGRDDYFGAGIVNAYGAVLGPDALYTVTFDYKDGLRPPVGVKVVPGSQLLSTYTPQLEGYAFAGWYITGTDTMFNFNNTVNGNLNLFAKWVIPQAGMYIKEFPDINFRRAVLQLLDTYGIHSVDGSMVADDLETLASITYLNVANKFIIDMTGLAYFSGLQILECYNNQITTLDLASNAALEQFSCFYNQLTVLNVSKNTALTGFSCDGNLLTTLDVSKNTKLVWLDCADNQLTWLDVSANIALKELNCYYNQLAALNLSNNIALEAVGCSYNKLNELNISKNTALWWLNCSSNQLKSLDTSNNTLLAQLYCYANQLTAIDISRNIVLEVLYCFENQLTQLDVSKNSLLISVDCDDNQLSTFDVSKNTALVELRCGGNKLTKLDLSNNTNLYYLACHYNQLSELDVSKNTALEWLYCYGSQLSSLDVSNNDTLWLLSCWDNQLTALDVSGSSGLMLLWCFINDLTTLDVSNNAELVLLDCRVNYLKSVDDVIGWQKNGLVLNDSLLYYPQKIDVELVAFSEAFPDANFCGEVLWRLNNDDGGNRTGATVINWGDFFTLASIEFLYVGYMNIADMTGLQYFAGLKELYCSGNQLSTLDTSNNTALRWLNCDYNQLTSLDVSKNAWLINLNCAYNPLRSLDITNNTTLNSLYCDNNYLSELDVSNNTQLWWLHCPYNYIASIDKVAGWREIGLIPGETFFFYPQIGGEPPTGKDITASFIDAGFLAAVREIVNKPVGSILDYDVAQISYLHISLWNTSQTIYDLSGIEHFRALAYLDCTNQQIAELDLSKNEALGVLYCSDNKLTALNLSSNTVLKSLNCSWNQLKTLDVSKNTHLERLECAYNQLTSLDVSKNTKLSGYFEMNDYGYWASFGLDCSGNQLTTLDLSQNTDLKALTCYENDLTMLDVSNNTALEYLNCRYNYLPSTNDVIGWQQIGLALFQFYPQKNDPGPMYTLTYDAQGGSPTPPPQTLFTGEWAYIDHTLPIRLGYTFLGWNTKPSGNGIYYQRGSWINPLDNDLELYAIWSPHEYSINDISVPSTSFGQITSFNPLLEAARGTRYDVYSVWLTYGQEVKIYMESYDFDSYLYLLDPNGDYITHDDDSGGNLNAMITFTAPTAGRYYILASQWWEDFGNYMLSVSASEPMPTLTVDSATVGAGNKVTIPVRVSNSPSLASLQFRVYYPNYEMKLTDVTIPNNSGFNVQHGINPGQDLVSLVPKGTDPVDPNGALLFLTFDISRYAFGWFSIELFDIRAVDENDSFVPFTATSGMINTFRYGDFTGNWVVDGNDILWINRYIDQNWNLQLMKMRWPTTIDTFCEPAADFTNNGEIDGTDVLWIHRYIASDCNPDEMIRNWPSLIDFSHLGVKNTMVAQAFNIPNYDLANNSLYMTSGKKAAAEGERLTVTVGLDLQSGTELAALCFSLNYDTTVLRLIPNEIQFPGRLTSVSTGPLDFSLSPKGTDAQLSGDVISLVFEVLDASKQAVIELEANRARTPDDAGINLPAPASVVINEATSTTYNYSVYFATEKTSLNAGDTLYVDVMLTGNINYTQAAAEIAYDTSLLEFAGYDNLQGWAASVAKVDPNKVALRSVPSMNMTIGTNCSPAIRVVTLKFKVNGSFDGDSIDTDLSFASILVSGPGGVLGATTAPGKSVNFSLHK